MEKIVYGVSLGAGKETLTIKGMNILKDADVILLSGSKCFNNPTEVKEILAEIGCSHKLIFTEMPASSQKDDHEKHTKAFAEKCINFINEGKKVAYVTMGDITVYSSFGELNKIFQKMGIKLEAISGVSAFMAPAALAGVAVVEWREKFCVVPMPEKADELTKYVTEFDSVLIMKIYDDGKVLKDFIVNEKPKMAVMVIDAYKDSQKIFDLTEDFPIGVNFGMAVVLIKGA